MTDHEPHVSDLRWDRLLAGDLPAEERDAAVAHAASCTACAARQRDLTAQRDAFAHPMPSFATLTATRDDNRLAADARDMTSDAPSPSATRDATPLAPSPPATRGDDRLAAGARGTTTGGDELASARAGRRSRVVWLAPLGAVAAAAAIVLVIGRRGDTPSGELTKGEDGPALVLSVEQAGRLISLGAGDVVHPGDHLQATYSANVDGYGAVLARDGAGIASAYVPSSGDVMVKLPSATDAAFPESTILDDVTGTERIAIVWCAQARPLAPLIAAMSTGAPLAEPAGCHIRELELAKRVAP